MGPRDISLLVLYESRKGKLTRMFVSQDLQGLGENKKLKEEDIKGTDLWRNAWNRLLVLAKAEGDKALEEKLRKGVTYQDYHKDIITVG